MTIFPEGAIGDAQSQATLIRFRERANGSAHGYIAYSRVCTHAGCPVALYRAPPSNCSAPAINRSSTSSTEGAVVSGPADHALPRLPIEVGADGILPRARRFSRTGRAGFWERG